MSQNPWESQPTTNDATVPLNPQQVQATATPGYQYQQGGQPYGYQQQDYQGNYAPYTPEPAETTTGKKKHGTATVATAALLAALVGGGVGGGIVAATNTGNNTSSVTTAAAGTTIVNNTESVNYITAAAAKASASSVTIAAASSSASGSGSGVILDDEGHILTNTHVVTLDGATASATIEVQLADGSVRTASIVGTDPTSDLAVIKLDNTAGLTLTPATLGDSDALNVGATAIAIGAPLGLENTVTTGIVSNLLRTIEVASSAAPEGTDSSDSSQSTDPFGSSPFQFEIPGQQSTSATSTISINVIQTDAAVNPGNSGGALVNADGEVIGINVAIASTSSSESSSGNIGVGFAIPVNYAKRVAQEIIDTGSATHGLLGASVSSSPANNDQSAAFGDGALIQEVTSGGAADQAGLKRGDVVTAVNGRTIRQATELTAAVRQAAAGEEVTLTIERSGSTQDVTVTLGKVES